MVALSEAVEKIEKLQFNLEKAEFNDNPTNEIEKELGQVQSDLVKILVEELDHHLPRLLPPLQVHNPKPVLETPPNDELIELLERVGVDDDDDSLLLKLNGEQAEYHELLNLMGVWYVYQYQADQATGYFQEIATTTVKDEVQFNLAYALAVQKVLLPALEELDKINDDFNPALVLLNRAVIYDKLGRYENAKENYQKALEETEKHAIILYNWSLSAVNFGKLGLARNLLKKLLQSFPNYPGVHAQLGQVAAREGFYTEAIDAFLIAHKEDPDNLDILSDLATASLMGKRYDDAIEYYEKYLDSATNLSVLNNLGAAYMQTKQYKKAKSILEQALEINPNHKKSLKNYKTVNSYLD